MILKNIEDYKTYKIGGLILICMAFLFPIYTESSWFNIVVRIREAINTGDSGHLILASASASFLYALQISMFFLGTILLIHFFKQEDSCDQFRILFISPFLIILLNWLSAKIFYLTWEPVTVTLSVLVATLLSGKLIDETNSFLYVTIASSQVFFAFQWLNIMPSFSNYFIGKSDIPYSIKIAGMYLKADSVLNFMGFAFFFPFVFSAFITATLFISNAQKMSIVKENYDKEREIEVIKAKVLENRIYQEINLLTHDLKTPLVTIRGLNSLITVCENPKKLREYSERIENSVNKMSEMISSFLYESSRQTIKTTELFDYIRAQLPLENDSIKIHIKIDENLPNICVNKVRVARAMINILENAIVAPCKYTYKQIQIELIKIDSGINFIISDNAIGIKPDELSKIWEVGYSTNNTSGLGLPFAKHIIENNKGTISIKSIPDEGTIVTVFIPAA